MKYNIDELHNEIQNIKELFPKFNKLKIRLIYDNDYYSLHHYMPYFDINNMDFHKMIEIIIKEVFYNKGIFNVTQRNLTFDEAYKNGFVEFYNFY